MLGKLLASCIGIVLVVALIGSMVLNTYYYTATSSLVNTTGIDQRFNRDVDDYLGIGHLERGIKDLARENAQLRNRALQAETSLEELRRAAREAEERNQWASFFRLLGIPIP